METLKTILYFSIFKYPLKIEEIHSYTNHLELGHTADELQHLLAQRILTKVDDFYVYGNDLDSVTRRMKGNILAKKALVIAKLDQLWLVPLTRFVNPTNAGLIIDCTYTVTLLPL